MYRLTPTIAKDHFARKERALKASLDGVSSCDVVCEYQIGLLQGYRFVIKDIVGGKALEKSLPVLTESLLEADKLRREDGWEYHRGIVDAYVEALRYIKGEPQ